MKLQLRHRFDINLQFSDKTKNPTTSIVKTMVIGVIAVIAIASALAVYGAEHKQPKLFSLADKILQIHHSVIDIGRDWVTYLHGKK